MTRNSTRNHSLSVVALFFAVLTLLIAGAVLAQAQRPSKPSTDGAGRFPVNHSQTERPGARPTDSNPLFLPVVTYGSGASYTNSVAAADVNGDGKPDLILSSTSACVAVLLGNGDGTFQPAVCYYSGEWYSDASYTFVAVADVNGDGTPDLILANECGYGSCASGAVGVLLGNGDGTFRYVVTYDSGGFIADSVAVGDVNGDGKPDLVVADCAPSGQSCGLGGGQPTGLVGVLLGNGDGTFQPVVTYDSGGTLADSVTIADVNGDGKPDLLVANFNSATVGVLLGNGDGTFQPAVSYSTVGPYTTSVAVADVNGDGKPDLVVANSCGINTNCSATAAVLLGNGDGTFQSAVAYDAGGYQSSSVAVADVNGDGYPDLVVANMCATVSDCALSLGFVGVLLGNGDGTFQPVLTFGSGGYRTYQAVIADVNLDGKPDLLLANPCTTSSNCGTEGSVGVLLNNIAPDHGPTATTLVSSQNPSVYRQTVTFAAQVTASSGTPTGTVVLLNGSTLVGSGTLTNGSVSIALSSLPVGADSITASYHGFFSSSTSAPVNQDVNMATTTTSLVPSANPAAIKRRVTYTAIVTSQYGGAATGTVTFQDGGSTIATVPLANNRAAYSTSYNSVGIHLITAAYSGDANNVGGTSSALIEKVGRGNFPSTTTLTTSASPSDVGQAVTFTATVASIYGRISDGELVTFYDGSTEMGTGATVGGATNFTTSSLSAKTHGIKAKYAGDDVFEPSVGLVTQVVDKWTTTTALVSSLNPAPYGQAVTFTATVASSGPNTPTGRVAFKDGTTGIGAVTLSAGVATLVKPKLAVATHPITAQYLGDTVSAPSTSPVLYQVVQ